LNVEVEIIDWLSFWWQPLLKDGWHAAIVTVPQIWIDRYCADKNSEITRFREKRKTKLKMQKGRYFSVTPFSI